MILVQDPDGSVTGDFPPSQFISYAKHDSFLAPESSKNSPAIHHCVNAKLKPLVRQLWTRHQPLFRNVFVETRSRCNAACSFCPTNKNADPRPEIHLAFDALSIIASQLNDLSFSGTLHLFCNNEPLLDPHIVETVQTFRSACPGAEVKILTNGAFLSLDLVDDLFGSGLDVLVINNYTNGKLLIRPVRELLNQAKQFHTRDIRLSMRKLTEVLTSRAGQAPNKANPAEGFDGFCALPFTDFVISASGEVRQCCFDALEVSKIGDVRREPLKEIWLGSNLQSVREDLMLRGRKGLALCATCDFDGYRYPGIRTVARSDFCAEEEDRA